MGGLLSSQREMGAEHAGRGWGPVWPSLPPGHRVPRPPSGGPALGASALGDPVASLALGSTGAPPGESCLEPLAPRPWPLPSLEALPTLSCCPLDPRCRGPGASALCWDGAASCGATGALGASGAQGPCGLLENTLLLRVMVSGGALARAL